MKIALIDDDLTALEQLKEMLTAELLEQFSHIPFEIHSFSDGETFLSQWRAGQYDMILSGILMTGIGGLEIARTIRQTDPDVRIVFCSRSNGFAAESYQVNAKYYLLKPVTREAVCGMLSRLDPDLIRLRKTVTLPDGHTLLLRQILFTEYHNHVVHIYMKGGTVHRLRTSHSTIEELLLPCGYILCSSKGMLLNLYEVINLSGDSVLMSNGASLPVSRRRSKEFQTAYNAFRLKEMQAKMRR